jgi:hypothetical protein
MRGGAGGESRIAIFGRRGYGARASVAIRAAVPGWRVALAGGAIWAVAMSASAVFGAWWHGWQTTQKLVELALVFGTGGLVAFPLGVLVAGLAPAKRAETRYAAAFVALAAATVLVTAGLYAIQYRLYYARWHADAFTLTWMLQFLVTSIVGYVQFAVTGIRLYFPIGFASLFLAALWFARRQS